MPALKPRRLLLDTNVWMAYFIGNERVCRETTALIKACVLAEVELMYTPTSLKDLFYLVPRQLKRLNEAQGATDVGPEAYRAAAWACAESMRDLGIPALLSAVECDLGHMLHDKNGDLEDNLMIAAAQTCGASFVVTYDAQMVHAFAPVCVGPLDALRAVEVWS